MTERTKVRHVWVVEIMFDDDKGGGWFPVCGIALTKSDGHGVRRYWKSKNPADHFRIRKYARIK